jgi:thymidylate synthase ThyX
MKNIEEKYMEGADAGMSNDMLRLMLPHATAATVVMTCNIRE